MPLDEELLNAYCQGNPEALGKLYQAYEKRLFNFIYQKLVSQMDSIKDTDCERGTALW